MLFWPAARSAGGVSNGTTLLLARSKRTRFEWSSETVIYELEALAVAVALKLFDSHLCHHNVEIFTDNEGVHGSFVKC